MKGNTIFIEHIIESIPKIQEYTKESNGEEFLRNKLIQDAVIRNFEVIGEATKNLTSEFKKQHPSIEWRKIAGMRDKLIHDYMGVDLWAVWAVVTDILPNLLKELNKINQN